MRTGVFDYPQKKECLGAPAPILVMIVLSSLDSAEFAGKVVKAILFKAFSRLIDA